MSSSLQTNGNLSTSERRNHRRQKVLFSSAELGKNNGGIVLNFSEGGLAVQAVAELIDDELPRMRFEISRTHSWIETGGHIVWRTDSKRTAGVEFVDLPEEARNQIQTWISSASDAKLEEKTALVESADKSSEQTTPGNLSHTATLFSREPNPEHETTSGELAASSPPLRQLLVLFVGAGLLLLGLVFLGIYWQNKLARVQELQRAPASTTTPEVPKSSVSPVTAAPSAKVPSNVTGFILQVGAMSREQNANALAESLRQKNFPVFVIKPDTDRSGTLRQRRCCTKSPRATQRARRRGDLPATQQLDSVEFNKDELRTCTGEVPGDIENTL